MDMSYIHNCVGVWPNLLYFLVFESVMCLRGLVKLKKIKKSEQNSDWSDNKDPPA